MPLESQFTLMAVLDEDGIELRGCGRLTLGHGADDALWSTQFARAAGAPVALDLSCVTHIDARGIGVLATVTRQAMRRKLPLTVAGRAVSFSAWRRWRGWMECFTARGILNPWPLRVMLTRRARRPRAAAGRRSSPLAIGRTRIAFGGVFWHRLLSTADANREVSTES